VIVVPDRGDRDASQRDPAPAPETREQARLAPDKPEPPPTPTIIILRDGQKLELTDYAVTGDTLYDLHGGRTKKIAVSDIDLPATVRINEERGFEFTLPNAARVHIQ
jgi:endonuclease YncB( thermonuclease family)